MEELQGIHHLTDTHRETHTLTPLKGVCECLVSLMTCMTLMRVGRVSRVNLPVALGGNGQFFEDHLCRIA